MLGLYKDFKENKKLLEKAVEQKRTFISVLDENEGQLQKGEKEIRQLIKKLNDNEKLVKEITEQKEQLEKIVEEITKQKKKLLKEMLKVKGSVIRDTANNNAAIREQYERNVKIAHDELNKIKKDKERVDELLAVRAVMNKKLRQDIKGLKSLIKLNKK